MPSLGVICATAIAAVAAFATLGQAMILGDFETNLTSSPFRWGGTLSDGTAVALNGTYQSLVAQIYEMDPEYPFNQKMSAFIQEKSDAPIKSADDTMYYYNCVFLLSFDM